MERTEEEWQNIVDKAFIPSYRYKTHVYFGKHVLEKQNGDYISTEQFIKILQMLDIPMKKKNGGNYCKLHARG